MIALMFALLLENQTGWLFRTVPTSVPMSALTCPNGRKIHAKWVRGERAEIRSQLRVWCPGPK
jgi:hypothetical protein